MVDMSTETMSIEEKLEVSLKFSDMLLGLIYGFIKAHPNYDLSDFTSPQPVLAREA